MKKKPGYPCEGCGKTRKGAHTDILRDKNQNPIVSTAVCPECFVDGKMVHYTFIAHLDSDGICEAVSGKCQTHGEIKRLFAAQQQPYFQKNYYQWMTAGATEGPPKITKEI